MGRIVILLLMISEPRNEPASLQAHFQRRLLCINLAMPLQQTSGPAQMALVRGSVRAERVVRAWMQDRSLTTCSTRRRFLSGGLRKPLFICRLGAQNGSRFSPEWRRADRFGVVRGSAIARLHSSWLENGNAML